MVEFPLSNLISPKPVSVTDKPLGGKTAHKKNNRERLRSPGRARLNIIPNDSRIEELVTKAINALRKGIYWDRGSIVNIVL